MKKLKLLIIPLLLIGIALLIGTTYALWHNTKYQNSINKLSSASCFDISYSNETGTLNLSGAVPMPDINGQAQTPYTFTLTNNCTQPINYLVNLNLYEVEGATNLNANQVNLAIDKMVGRTIDNYAAADLADSAAYSTKNLTSGYMGVGESVTHQVKMWVDETVGNEAASASFKSRLNIAYGPNLTIDEVTPEDCFVFDEGTILTYKSFGSCPTDVIVPAQINGEDVEAIYPGAFIPARALLVIDYTNDVSDFVVFDEDYYDELVEYFAGDGDFSETSDVNYTKASEYTDWEKITLDSFTENEELYVVSLTLGDFDDSLSWDYYIPNTIDNTYITPYFTSLDFSKTSITEIPDLMAFGTLTLAKVEFPEGLTKIGKHAFHDAYEITKLYLPTTLSYIDEYAFNNNKLSFMEFNSEMYLGKQSFYHNNLRSLQINKTLTFAGVYSSSKFAFPVSALRRDQISIGYYSSNTVDQIMGPAE